MSDWEIFPYELEGLTVKPLADLQVEETPRRGEDPGTCWCAQPDAGAAAVWRNERWVLNAWPSGLPFYGSLSPLTHHDLPDLPAELAAEMGVLAAAIGAAVESLPSVGRVHVSKWGDGGAHLHLMFMGRPARMGQLRGSCLPQWFEHLPQLPGDVHEANVAAVVAEMERRLA